MNVLGHSDEGRDALIRAGLAQPVEARAAWEAWVRSGADSTADPIASRWMPLIGWNLRNAGLDEATQDRWRISRLEAWSWNMRAFDAARPALATLSASGIPITLLKGAALAATVYPLGLRPAGDVDVLVPFSEGLHARDLLVRDGWVPQRPTAAHLLPLRHAEELHKPPNGAIDLHWHLLPECCWPGADDGAWRRRRPLEIDGLSAAVLDPADELIHVCVHGLRWSPVHAGHWIADVAWIIQAHADLDWSIVVDEARQRDLGLQVREALACVKGISGAPVPDDVIRALDAQPVSTLDRLECWLKGRPVVTAGGLFVIWCGWRRAVRIGARRIPWLAYLSSTVGLPSERHLARWFARHAKARLRAFLTRGRRRGASTRERLTSASAP